MAMSAVLTHENREKDFETVPDMRRLSAYQLFFMEKIDTGSRKYYPISPIVVFTFVNRMTYID